VVLRSLQIPWAVAPHLGTVDQVVDPRRDLPLVGYYRIAVVVGNQIESQVAGQIQSAAASDHFGTVERFPPAEVVAVVEGTVIAGIAAG
jgi:hypothetical protein